MSSGAVWDAALGESRLPVFTSAEETLDLGTTDRCYEAYVEPVGGQNVDRFCVTAKLSWRWTAALAARMCTCEEDLLSEVLGRQIVDDVETHPPELRVDIVLTASSAHKLLPMPEKAVWARWYHETMERLKRIEPIIPEKQVRETDPGQFEILAWRGEPELEAICEADGEIMLAGIKLSAWQVIEIPRQWDDPLRAPDDHPAVQLGEMFARVRATLYAWAEVMDHLR